MPPLCGLAPKGANSLCMQALEVAASCGDKRWPQIYAASHTTAFFLGGLTLKVQFVISHQIIPVVLLSF